MRAMVGIRARVPGGWGPVVGRLGGARRGEGRASAGIAGRGESAGIDEGLAPES